MSFFSTVFTLFLLMDSIGNIPLFISILKKFPPKKQRRIIFRELVIALVIMLIFSVMGERLLSFLKIQHYTILIAGGIILFMIAINMIFPKNTNDSSDSDEKDPFIVPLAIPLVAGPASLAWIMLYSHHLSIGSLMLAIFIAWIFTTIILLTSSNLHQILGQRGLTACERLMGLILTLLAVQMFLEGVNCFLVPSCNQIIG